MARTLADCETAHKGRRRPPLASAAVRYALALWLFVLGASCAADAKDSPDATQPPAGMAGDAGLRGTDAGAGATAPTVLVGTVDGGDVALGAVVAGGRMRLFFCGGASSYAQATRWLQLALDADGRFALTFDGGHVHGQLQGAHLDGELARDGGAAAAFAAARAAPDSLAGLYEAGAECGRIGLIVVQAGRDQPISAQGACVGPGHTPEQVNPILPLARDADGTIAVEVVQDGSAQPARVHAAAPPDAP